MTIGRRQFAAVALAVVLVLSLLAVTVDVGRSTETSEEAYDAVVVFRNDDVQAGYAFETMRAVDRIFVEEDVPVSLGVIGDGLEADGRTCSYLRDLIGDHGDQFEIVAHGDTHEAETEFGTASEFGGLDRDAQAEKADRMTEQIETCTGERPTSFIAPFDTYDRTTVDVLAERGYETVSGGPHTRTQFNATGEIDVTGAFEARNVTHVPQSQALVADWDTHEHHDLETLESSFESAAENGSIYVQMLHYHTLTDPEDRERLRSFVRSIKEYGDVRFATLGELGELVRNDEIRYDEGDGTWYVTETTEGDLDVSFGLDAGVPFGLPEARAAVSTATPSSTAVATPKAATSTATSAEGFPWG